MTLTKDERDYIDWLNSIEFVDEHGNVITAELEPDDGDDDEIDAGFIEFMEDLILDTCE